MTLIEITQSLLLSFSAVFIMEMGDKTQLTAFALSMKYRSPLKVFFGAFFGLTGVTIIAVIIGIIMKNTIEVSFLKPIIGILFILGGLIFLFIQFRKHHDRPIKICPVDLEFCNKPHENCPDMQHCDIYLKTIIQKGGFIGSFSFMFLAELGDKTMLMGVGLATQFDPWGVIFGAVFALSLVNGIGVYAGEKLATKIPRDKIDIICGLLFILLGLVILLM